MTCDHDRCFLKSLIGWEMSASPIFVLHEANQKEHGIVGKHITEWTREWHGSGMDPTCPWLEMFGGHPYPVAREPK